MGAFSMWHWLIVLIVLILLFGKGRVPELMADIAKGIKSFRKGMADDSLDDAPDLENEEKPRSNKKR